MKRYLIVRNLNLAVAITCLLESRHAIATAMRYTILWNSFKDVRNEHGLR
ncbi:hypothetical protein [Oceanirhabdus seepicola]|uniref:Uncharacterized protein n=1 Tax=Oceanirhabdus seepicola TaxID=2828781 RepID=A0A9J6PET3_9CLOT|nr:hypothetical protein [Oceanirhabdus seepicola]MCM1992784.1 hypothetical protein [Oceanirhabdus seepicola]